MSVELVREDPQAPRGCRLCGRSVDGRVCTACGVDLVTGDLVAPPAEPEPPGRDGRRPVRREALAQATLAEIPRTSKELLGRGAVELSHGLGGTLACLALVAFGLSFGEIPVIGAKIPWSGQLGATFVLAFLLVERARGAHEGRGGALGSSGAFDPSALGSSLLSAVFLLPVLAGLFSSGPVVGLAAGVPLLLLVPAVLGALACESAQELTPARLLEAVLRSPGYARTTFWIAVALAVGLVPVWLLEGSAVWRAPIAVAGVGLAGALAGSMRRDAESVPED